MTGHEPLTDGGPTHSRLGVFWAFLFFFGAIASPACNAILSLRIPLSRPGSIGIIGAIALIALLITIVSRVLSRRANALVYGIVILAFIDVAFGGSRLAQLWGASFQWMGVLPEPGRFCVVLAAVASAYAVPYLLGDNAAVVLGVVFTAILSSTLLLQGRGTVVERNLVEERTAVVDDGAEGNDKPAVVVLLFDELMSAEGFSDVGVPEDVSTLKHRIYAFHERFGFRLYPRTYSRHYWTQHAMPDLVNFDYARTSRAALYVKRPDGRFRTMRVVENALFDQYAKKGYTIEVFQTDHLYFCENPAVSYCATLDSYNPVSQYATTVADAQAGVILNLAIRSIKNSFVIDNLLKGTLEAIELPEPPPHINVLAFNTWFEAVKVRILASGPGKLVFAHIMAPHSPYMLNEDCSVTINWTVPYRLAERLGDESEIQETYRDSYIRYFRQVHCLYSKMESLFSEIDLMPELSDGTFIFMGDHGSRISRTNFAFHMDERDLTDNYATHFAIRSKGIVPGIDQRMESVQRIFAEQFLPLSGEGQNDQGSHMVLADVEGENEFAQVEMVDFGALPRSGKIKRADLRRDRVATPDF